MKAESEPASASDPQTGSPHGEPVFLAVARFGRPHGVRGDILLHPLTDFPERLAAGGRFWLGEQKVPVRLASVRNYRRKKLVRIEGVVERSELGRYSSQLLFVRAADVPSLPEGEYYHHQLLGLQVRTTQGENIGRIREILETGANDVYLVEADDRTETLIPCLDEVVLDVDLINRVVVVQMPPGLAE